MQISGNNLIGTFLERPNRFLAKVKIDSSKEVVLAHVADPGRLIELLKPSVKVYLRKNNNPKRKTQYSLVAVQTGEEWVNINSIVANRYIAENFQLIPFLNDYTFSKAEYNYGKSRLDFLFLNSQTKKRVLVEVKSVTLKENNFGLFPDAPTLRGKKHVVELMESINDGYEAMIIFVMKRKGVKAIKPNKKIDPKFTESLEFAYQKGVILKAFELKYNITKNAEEFSFDRELPVIIDSDISNSAIL